MKRLLNWVFNDQDPFWVQMLKAPLGAAPIFLGIYSFAVFPAKILIPIYTLLGLVYFGAVVFFFIKGIWDNRMAIANFSKWVTWTALKLVGIIILGGIGIWLVLVVAPIIAPFIIFLVVIGLILNVVGSLARIASALETQNKNKDK